MGGRFFLFLLEWLLFSVVSGLLLRERGVFYGVSDKDHSGYIFMKKHSIVPVPLHNSGTRIVTLSAAHFIVDLLGGTLPGVLPVALQYFKINLGLGVVILTSMSIGCNMMQIPAAMLDRHHRTPRLLALGLAMAGMIVLLAAMPATTPFFLICLLMLVVGAGIAIVHPLGLRGTQHISSIAPSITTPAFMTAGFLGSAIGPWISAVLLSRFELKGLYFLLIPVAVVIVALRFSNVKLAVDQSVPKKVEPAADAEPEGCSPWSFRSLMIIGMLLNTGTITVQNLLPLQLVRQGLELSFGGLSAMLFGAGSAIGSLSLGVLTRRRSPLPFIFCGLALGIPVLCTYFLFSRYQLSCILIFFAGMLASSCFPILVAMARNAEGRLALSTRMALIVGGTWGFAGIMLLPIGQLAHRIGLDPVMHLSWIFYLITLAVAALTVRRRGLSRKNTGC